MPRIIPESQLTRHNCRTDLEVIYCTGLLSNKRINNINDGVARHLINSWAVGVLVYRRFEFMTIKLARALSLIVVEL